jgi:DNA-directed RNA polymerase subunit F
MAGTGKKHLDNNKVTKKEARKVVYEKLAGALAEFKGTVGEKKFRNKLKKASKLFAVDIAKAAKKIPKIVSADKEVITAQ